MRSPSSGGRPGPSPADRAVWIALIVTSGLCLSTFFACVTPFAALATVAALKLSRRDMFAVVGLVWLANQAVGYGWLGYPWTWDSAAWGFAIAASAGLAVLAAKGLSTTRPAPFAVSLPFVAAFVAFELCLYAAGFVLPWEHGAFSARVVGQVFMINSLTLCGVMAVYHLVRMVELLVRPASIDVSAASFR